MKRFFMLCVFALVLCFVSAVAFADDNDESVGGRAEIIDNWTSEAMEEFGDSMDAIIKKLGKPQRRESKKQPNRHNEENTDVIETLYYDGFEITTMGDEAGEWFFMIHFKTDIAQRPIHGIKVGDSPDKLIKALGKPDKETSNEISYEGDYSTVAAALKNGKISSVNASYFPD